MHFTLRIVLLRHLVGLWNRGGKQSICFHDQLHIAYICFPFFCRVYELATSRTWIGIMLVHALIGVHSKNWFPPPLDALEPCATIIRVSRADQMVQVATKLDLPIKLLWPKSVSFSSDRGFTMLGLGDIVIPGTFIALALRYDYARFASGMQTEADSTLAARITKDSTGLPAVSQNLPSAKTKASTVVKLDQDAYEHFIRSAPKPYFSATLTAYVLGLVTTMLVMHVFHAAQPALLYLR